MHTSLRPTPPNLQPLPQTTVNNLDTNVLGTCAHFEERQVGGQEGPACLRSTSTCILLPGRWLLSQTPEHRISPLGK